MIKMQRRDAVEIEEGYIEKYSMNIIPNCRGHLTVSDKETHFDRMKNKIILILSSKENTHL